MAVAQAAPVPWWREPTKDQWLAYVAAWLGWTLDAFDFTIFLLIMVPIAQEFNVPLVEVTFVFTVTLWLRLLGATASGWMADRMGRKTPLMISILWYSICNFIAGFSPTFWFLFLFRALLGIGMGAEWPAGAALAMESWPTRSRGFMSGVLQGSWGLGFLLSSAAYGLLYDAIGWRGLLWIGVLAGLGRPLRPEIREGTRGLEGEPREAADAAAGSPSAADRDLQAEDAGQHADGLPVDGQRLCRLLHDLRSVSDASAEGSAFQPGRRRAADRPGQSDGVSVELPVGLDRRPDRKALGDDYPGDRSAS